MVAQSIITGRLLLAFAVSFVIHVVVVAAVFAIFRPSVSSSSSSGAATPSATVQSPIPAPGAPATMEDFVVTPDSGSNRRASPTMPATPTPSPVPPSAPSPVDRTHVVQSGESFWKIAKKYGVTIDELAAANGMGKNHVLKAGERLRIPK